MKKITLFLFALLNVCILNLSAQTFQNIISSQTSSLRGYCVAQGVDGNMLFAAIANNGSRDYPLLLTLNSDGTLNKAATIESLTGIVSNDINIAAVHTAKGKPNGYIVALNYAYDIILIRLNNRGAITWSKKFDAYNDIPVKIKPIYSPITSNLAGFYLLTSHWLSEYSLLKLYADGDIVWQKKIANPSNDDGYIARDILPTGEGGCIVVGQRKEHNLWNSSIAKFAPGGALQWNRSYDFFSSNYEIINAIAATASGYVLSGSTGAYTLTFKIDPSGNVLWANQYNNAETESRPKTVISDTNGNIIFTGLSYDTTSKSAYIVKLNSSGNLIFAKKYYDFAAMNDITLTPNGYCAIGAPTPPSIYILKTDLYGNIGGNCISSAMPVTKVPHEFITITEPRLKITADTFKVYNINLTPSLIRNFEQNWCGTNSAPLSKNIQPYTTDAGIFNASSNLEAKRIDVLFNKSDFKRSDKYEVILYNANGISVAKKSLQPNIPIHFSMSRQLPGIYITVLLKEGRIVERQNVVWVR